MIEAAPAKINLCLHVTGQRPDGYHLLDSIVVFADIGDRITVEPAANLSLTIDGPQAAGLAASDDNLVLRAARAFSVPAGAALRLTKLLPVSSGIGGGSADAAATLRVLARFWHLPLPDAASVLALGADVPVCLSVRPVRMRGVGEVLTPLPPLPPAHLLLVNPGVAVSTPAVFRGLATRINPALSALPIWATPAELCHWLAAQRNDLEPPAIALAPEIATARAAIAATSGCLLARMSGSGATCFGVYADAATARTARDQVRSAYPGWWVKAGRMLS